MPTRTITVQLRQQNAKAETVIFLPKLTGAAGDVVLNKFYKLTTDLSGAGLIDLPVPTTGTIRYDYILPGENGAKSRGYFHLPPGGTISFDELLVAGTPASQTTVDYVDEQIAEHEAELNPHPGYATDIDLAAHVAHADPHTVYALDTDLTAGLAAKQNLITNYNPDKPMPSPLFFDDFSGNALVGWQPINGISGAAETVSQSLYSLTLSGSSAEILGIGRALPTNNGTYTLIAKLGSRATYQGTPAAGYAGIFLSKGGDFPSLSNDDCHAVGLYKDSDNGQAGVREHVVDTNWKDNYYNIDYVVPLFNPPQYLKIHRSGASGKYYFYFSYDGIDWFFLSEKIAGGSQNFGLYVNSRDPLYQGFFDWIGIWEGNIDVIGG